MLCKIYNIMKEVFIVCKKILLLQTYIYKQLLLKYINLGDYFLLFCGGGWYHYS